MSATTAEYLDVFAASHEGYLQLILMVAFGVSFVIAFGLFILESPTVVTKTIASLALVVAVGSPIWALVDINLKKAEAEQVVANMSQNVKAKYGKEMKLVGSLAKAEDRDKPNRYYVVVRPEDTEVVYMMSDYMISFDRETNEPTITEVKNVKISTAEELEKSAQNIIANER